MNIYTWMNQEVPVPTHERSDHWKAMDRQMKKMDLRPEEREAVLQTGELPRLDRQEQVRRELADVPLFLFLYGSLVLCLAGNWQGNPFTARMPVGPGLLLQLAGVYAVFKLLLYGLNEWPEGPGRWTSLILFFLLYLFVIWMAGQADTVWFAAPVWLMAFLLALPWLILHFKETKTS